MSNRVLYNARYGGFSLSDEAWELVEYYCNKLGKDASSVTTRKRHHPILLRVFDELGSEAMSGKRANIQCKTLKGKTYRIEDYDGNETVVEPEDIHWITIK